MITQNLIKQYGAQTVLNSISLIFKENEITALLGQNGAGKTTLINILIGIAQQDEGSVFYFGEKNQWTNKDNSSVVFVCPQFDILWPSLTVEEHLNFFARLATKDNEVGGEQKKAILDKIGLQYMKKRIVDKLSGGMKRRLSIGLSLLGTQQIIILDEPTTGLDPLNRDYIHQMLKVKQKGDEVKQNNNNSNTQYVGG